MLSTLLHTGLLAFHLLPVQHASLSHACSLRALAIAVLTYLDVATSFSLFMFQLRCPLFKESSLRSSCSNHPSPGHSQNMTFEAPGHHCVVRSDHIPLLFPLCYLGPTGQGLYGLKATKCGLWVEWACCYPPLFFFVRLTCLCLLFLFIVSLLCIDGCPCDIKVFAIFVLFIEFAFMFKNKWLSQPFLPFTKNQITVR